RCPRTDRNNLPHGGFTREEGTPFPPVPRSILARPLPADPPKEIGSSPHNVFHHTSPRSPSPCGTTAPHPRSRAAHGRSSLVGDRRSPRRARPLASQRSPATCGTTAPRPRSRAAPGRSSPVGDRCSPRRARPLASPRSPATCGTTAPHSRSRAAPGRSSPVVDRPPLLVPPHQGYSQLSRVAQIGG